MKKFFIIVFAIASGLTMAASLQAADRQLEVITFTYPPVMGESSLSKEGILVELVRAAFAAEGVGITVRYLPVRRAIEQISSNESLAYIGVKNTFDAEVQAHIQEYPFFVSRFLLFYRNDRFPKGFGYQKLSDLKNYRIGVLGGGITDVVGKANKLNVDPVNTLELVFKKLDEGRDDIGVASEFSIELILHDLFKDRASEYAINKELPFHSINSVLLLNNRHPDFAYFEAKLKAGMKKIAANGQWQQILEKFYGTGKIPPSSKNLFESAVATY